MKRATPFQWLVILGIIFCICIFLVVAYLHLYSSVFETVQPDPTIEVSTNVPAAALNAILHLKIREPEDLLVTNYSSWSGRLSLTGGSFFGSFSGSSDNETIEKWDETRLIAINTEGFKVLFTKRWRLAGLSQKINQETNVILFRHGQVTETNTLGWKIVGKFK